MDAIGYARISTEAQDKMYGLDTQIEDIEKYAEDEGYNLLDIYSEDVSGASDFETRTQGKRIYDAISSGAAQVIIMPRPDRFSRSEYQTSFWLFLTHVDRHNAEWHFTNQGRVTKDIASVIIASVDQHTSSTDRLGRAENTRKGKRTKAKQGRHVGQGYPNFGYDKVYNSETDSKKLVINPHEAEHVRKIFDLYTEGYTLRKIAKWLDDNNIRPPQKTKRSAKTWGISTLRKVLTQTLYIAVYYYGKTRSEWIDTKKTKSRKVVQPKEDWIRVDLPELRIISDNQFAQVAERLELNKDVYRRNKARQRYPYHLSGFARCECGTALSGYYPRNRKPQYKASCLANNNACGRSDSGVITAEKIERQIFGRVWDAVNDQEYLEALIAAHNAELQDKQGETARRIDDLGTIAEDLEKQVENFLTNLGQTTNPGTVEIINNRIDQLTSEAKQARSERDALQEQAQEPIDTVEFIDDIIETWLPELDIFKTGKVGMVTSPTGRQVTAVRVPTEHAPDHFEQLELDPQKVRELYTRLGLRVTWMQSGEWVINLTLCNPSEMAPLLLPPGSALFQRPHSWHTTSPVKGRLR